MLEKLKVIEQRVFDNAGCEFDLLNNQQTREILIEKMGLPDKCLKELAQEHKIAADILEYRNRVLKESIPCENPGKKDEYVSLESYRIRKEWEIIQHFYDCLKVVTDNHCMSCTNKCEAYKVCKADLDCLYKDHNERFYEYLAEIINDFKCGLENGFMDLMI